MPLTLVLRGRATTELLPTKAEILFPPRDPTASHAPQRTIPVLRTARRKSALKDAAAGERGRKGEAYDMLCAYGHDT